MHLTASDDVFDFEIVGNVEVWACGSMGISKLDLATGEAQNFNEVNANLPSNQVETLAVGPDGTVWFSIWNEGLWAMRPSGAVEKINAPDPNGNAAFRAFETYPLGPDEVIFRGQTDWTGDGYGYWHLKNGSLAPVPSPFPDLITAHSASFVDLQKNLWAAQQGQIALFDGLDWQFFHTPNARVTSFAQAPGGTVWAVGYESNTPYRTQIFRIENGQIEKINSPSDAFFETSAIGFDALGQPVLHEKYKDKIWKLDGAAAWSSTVIAPPQGFLSPNYWLYEAKMAANGTLWLTGFAGNLSLFSIKNGQNQLKRWDNLGSSTVPSNRQSNIAVALDNQKFLVNWESLHRFDGQNWLEIPLPFSLDSNDLSLVGASPKDGALWLFKYDAANDWPNVQHALGRFDGFDFQFFHLKKPSGEPFSFAKSRLGLGLDGTVWLPTSDGKLWKMDSDGHFSEATDFPDSPSGEQIHDIFVDQKGRVWALNDHLFWLENGIWNDVQLTGLHPEFPKLYSEDDLNALFVSSADEVFFMRFVDAGTGFYGLFRWKNGALGHVWTPPGFDPGAEIYSNGGGHSVLEDSSKNIWLNVGGFGLFKIDASTTDWSWLNHENSGFPKVGARSMAIDDFQNIWMTTDCGLVVFNENGIEKLNFGPQPHENSLEKLVAAPSIVTERVEFLLPKAWPEGMVDFQIFDTKGQLVASAKAVSSTGSKSFSTAHFNLGLFFAQAKMGERRATVKFWKR